MASQVHSPLLPALFILSIILMLGGKASGGRTIPESSKEFDRRQPEWFFGSHGSIPIPWIGGVTQPNFPGSSGSSPGSFGSSPGSFGSSGGGTGSSGGYLPGGDGTSIPNPGVETPNPGSGGGGAGGVQMTTHP